MKRNTSEKYAWGNDWLLISLVMLLSVLLFFYFGSKESAVAAPEQTPGSVISGGDHKQEEESHSKRQVKTGAPVRFLMYNVHDYFVEQDVPRSSHKRKIKTVNQRNAVAQVIASARPEIVGLVEIGGEAALEDLAKRLAERDLSYPYKKVLTRWGEDRALGLLSMHPIVEDNSVAECMLVGRTKRTMLRGILDVSVQPRGDKRIFRIIGAHLKSHVVNDGQDPEAANELRAREARTLAEHVARAMKKTPDASILVYGDWNDDPTAPALGVLTRGSTAASALKRLSPKDSNDETWTIYYKPDDKYNTFDQIYVNQVLSKRMGRKAQMGIADERTAEKPSDHRAVWCDMY